MTMPLAFEDGVRLDRKVADFAALAIKPFSIVVYHIVIDAGRFAGSNRHYRSLGNFGSNLNADLGPMRRAVRDLAKLRIYRSQLEAPSISDYQQLARSSTLPPWLYLILTRQRADDFSCWKWLAIEEALTEFTPHRKELSLLGSGLDAFSHHFHTQGTSEVYHGCRDSIGVNILSEAPDERAIDLQHVDRELIQVG